MTSEELRLANKVETLTEHAQCLANVLEIELRWSGGGWCLRAYNRCNSVTLVNERLSDAVVEKVRVCVRDRILKQLQEWETEMTKTAHHLSILKKTLRDLAVPEPAPPPVPRALVFDCAEAASQAGSTLASPTSTPLTPAENF